MIFRNEMVNEMLEAEALKTSKLKDDIFIKLSTITEGVLRSKKTDYIRKTKNSISVEDKNEIKEIIQNFSNFNKDIESKIQKEALSQEETFLQAKALRNKRSSSRNFSDKKITKVSSHKEFDVHKKIQLMSDFDLKRTTKFIPLGIPKTIALNNEIKKN